MLSFFDDPDSDQETETGTSYRQPGQQTRASSSRASLAPSSPRAFSVIPGTDDDGRSVIMGGSELYEDEDEDEGNDVKRLGRIWVKERGTGDIMPWEGDLMDALFDKLEQQVRSLLILAVRGGRLLMTGENGEHPTE
jgi:hypothetical protein